jgi:hypothetical protein
MGIRRALVVLVAAALLGGCAGTDADDSGGDTVSPSPSSSPSSSPSASPSFPEDLPTPTPSGKPSGGALMEISGTIVAGVEMGCKLIDQYLLMPGPGINRDDLRVGAAVTVRGRVQQGMMTTCQQGTPFEVIEIVSR